jgi:hypothetical protein
MNVVKTNLNFSTVVHPGKKKEDLWMACMPMFGQAVEFLKEDAHRKEYLTTIMVKKYPEFNALRGNFINKFLSKNGVEQDPNAENFMTKILHMLGGTGPSGSNKEAGGNNGNR